MPRPQPTARLKLHSAAAHQYALADVQQVLAQHCDVVRLKQGVKNEAELNAEFVIAYDDFAEFKGVSPALRRLDKHILITWRF